jgi:hypothetical protein
MRLSAVKIARLLVALLAFCASSAFALTFSTDYRVSTLAGSSQQPRIAGEVGTTNLHLVWVEYFSAGDAQIYYARSTNNGISWEAARPLTATPGVHKLAPTVAAWNGSVVVVWNTDFDTGGIQYVRSANSGATFTGPATLFDATGYSRNPEIIADSAGHYIVTWYDSSNSGGPIGHVFTSLSCDGGATWATQDLTFTDGSVDSEFPTLALDSVGNTWLSYRGTKNGDPQGGWPPFQQYLTRVKGGGCGSGLQFMMPAAPVSPGLPDAITSVYGGTIATGPGGRINIAYWNNNAGNNIGFRTGTIGVGGFSAPIDASGEGQANPQITAGNSDVGAPGMAQDNVNNLVHIFWWQESNVVEGFKVGNLRYRTVNVSGATPVLGSVANLVANNVTMTPKAAYFGGRVHVVWVDFRTPGTSAEIFHKYANEDGSAPSSAPTLSLSETAYLFPPTGVGSTSAAHAFTLSNTGNAPLTVSGIGASAEFAQTNNCPASLAPAAACTINATFSPAATGLRNGSITISNNASGNPHTIALTGNGEDANADSDGDGIPNGVEPSVGLNPSVKDNDIFNVGLLFAMQQYRDFLNREGDTGGVNFWTNQINTGATTRGQTVEAFFNSAEFQNTTAPVVRLYFAYFNRIPDYPGLTFWINFSKAGHSLDEISNFFAGSAEFTSTYGSLDNSQFVNLVYQNVLGRAPDSGGFTFWVNQLNTGQMSRGQVMRNFSESDEYRSTSFNRVYVTMMYSGMLRRAPDQGGFDFWVGFMNGGQSGLSLINGFLVSAEYHNRFLP